MRVSVLFAIAVLTATAACKEVQDLPKPLTDAGINFGPEDAGPIPDGAIGGPCPCHPSLVEVGSGDNCVCRRPCLPSDPIPRCEGWEMCAQLRQNLADGGSQLIDAGVCLPAAAPDESCAPTPCAEILVCASIAGRDGGSTCRYPCNPNEDAGIEDATGADAIPAPGHCPPGQTCFGMSNSDAGACFTP